MGVVGPRFDKVVQVVRAPAGTAIAGLTAVTLNSGGSVIPAGTANALGVCCPGGTIAAGDPIAMMLSGEVVDFTGSIGTEYYSTGGGTIGTAASGNDRVGFTVEGSRLVVDM